MEAMCINVLRTELNVVRTKSFPISILVILGLLYPTQALWVNLKGYSSF